MVWKSAWPLWFVIFAGLLVGGVVTGQNDWNKKEKGAILALMEKDFPAAKKRVKKHGVDPLDFGADLLALGMIEDAKKWYSAYGGPKGIFGLATAEWKTGNFDDALKHCYYLLKKKPTPIEYARIKYLMGAVSADLGKTIAAVTFLQESFDAYGAIEGKYGGQYLALSMMAWLKIEEGKFDEVDPLLERADEYNQKIATLGFEPYGPGRILETKSLNLTAQDDYHGALIMIQTSQRAYRKYNKLYEVDVLASRIGLLHFLVGNPKKAEQIAIGLYTDFNGRGDRAEAAAINEITLAKLDQCTGNETNMKKREKAVHDWAKVSSGGKPIVKLWKFILDREKIPCPEWR